MKSSQRKSHTASTHQTVTEEIKLRTGKKTIKIGMTDQKLSAHAGQATFWGFVHLRKFRQVLGGVLQFPITSPNALKPVEIALSFITGVLAGADKLTRIAHLRHDPLLPELVEVERFPSQSTLTRFLARFDGAAKNLRSFRPLWRWVMERLPSHRGGYSLDLDSTELLHEDGHQEGVKVGYTRSGLKPCLHPLLAVLEEAKVVVQFWLRAGNAPSASNVISFTLDLLANLPRHIRLRIVRADSGFCQEAWLALLESQKLSYIVVAQLSVKLRRLVSKGTVWLPTVVEGTEVADILYQSLNWTKARRIILIRHRVKDKKRAGGKLLIDCPGYAFQALVTNLPLSVCAIDVWRDYNGRAGIEGVIKQLDYGFGLPKFCCKRFWATEAALSLAVMTYNLAVLFQRHLGWLDRVDISTLRYRLFATAGIISQTHGATTIRLGVAVENRPWWRRIWQKILSELPNCNAVAQSPSPA
jgi:Transposase DDE domain group 1